MLTIRTEQIKVWINKGRKRRPYLLGVLNSFGLSGMGVGGGRKDMQKTKTKKAPPAIDAFLYLNKQACSCIFI